MKIVAHMIDSRFIGGTEQVLLQLWSHLDRQRWRPVLLHHREPGLATLLGRARQMDVDAHAIPRIDRAYQLSGLSEMLRVLRGVGPAIFHAQLTWPLSCKYSLAAAAMAGVPGVVATAHLEIDCSAKPLVRIQPRFIARTVDRYLAVSSSIARQLRDQFRIPRAKVEVVHNGIDPGTYQRPRNAALRNSLTGGTDQKVVMTVARLEERKGYAYLIDTIPRVDGAVFVCVGDGPDRLACQAQARRLGVEDRVRFLGERADIPDLLACADVFVLASLAEGLPLSILEAMAAGVPVVATKIGGVDELVTPGVTGLLAPPGDPQSLAEAIRSLLTDPSTGRRYAAAALARVSREFAVDQMARRVGEVYEEILSA